MTAPVPAPRATRPARALELALTLFASGVFVVLWIYVALAAFTDAALPAETWDWLTSLDLLPAIVVWIAVLPLGVFLWAWQAGLEPLPMGLLMLGLVVWTGIAWSGLARKVLRRRSATT